MRCCSVPAQGAHAAFPGGNGRIAFAREVGVHQSTLWSVDPQTRRLRRLTRVPSPCGRLETWEDWEPAYSPTGRQILYVHRDTCGRGEREAIYRMRADGTRKELLVRAQIQRGFRLYSPTWSPDGRRLAFFSDHDDPMLGPMNALYLTSARRQAAPRVTKVPGEFPHRVGKISWGPARMIAFDGLSTGGEGVGLVNPDTGRKRGLLRFGSEPEWGPRASWIAFSRSLGDQDDPDTPTLAAVYVTRRNGRGLRRVVGARGTKGFPDTDQKRTPAWSPDGRQLAYVWDSGERKDLYVVSARGGRRRRLASDVELLGRLSWQALPRSRSSRGRQPSPGSGSG